MRRRWRTTLVLAGISVVLMSAHHADAEENCNQEIELEVAAGLSALGPEDDATVAEAANEETPAATLPVEGLETPVPTEWAESSGRDCSRRSGRVACDGPRRVPRPLGEAADLASRLGIGDRNTAHQLLVRGPDAEWVAVAGTEAPDDQLRWPVDGARMWRGFGRVRQRRGVRHRLHKGIDVGASEGTLFRSVSDGLVVYSDNGVRGYGNLTMVVHPDGSVAFYAHARANYLFAGQHVRRGQVIGEVGHTGLARGDHLHFELRVEGRPVNPMRRMEQPDPPLRPAEARARD